MDIETNMVIGKVLTMDELFARALRRMSPPARVCRCFMGFPGESLKGVFRQRVSDPHQPDEGLSRGQQDPDPAQRQGRRRGRRQRRDGRGALGQAPGREKVYIVYRRGMEELPARREEVEHAEEEGIIFKTLTNPVEVLGNENGEVCGMRCGDGAGRAGCSGRRRPIVKEGSAFVLDVDTMIMSIGTSPNPLIRHTTPGLETNRHGGIVTNGEDGLTSREGVYAGGDASPARRRSSSPWARAKYAAKAIDEYIMEALRN